MTDALVQRDTGAEREDEQRNDEAPEVELATVAQRVELVGWLRRPVESIQQENLGAGIDDEGMASLAMAELPVRPLATNFVDATRRLPSRAA